jgi:D-alanyl-D-alanine-carboxypeptidase/D-alanyl-D-alanine-endopeptidase
MWVELLMALMVEVYREFLEWWQTRPGWLAGTPSKGDESRPEGADRISEPTEDRAANVADIVNGILDRRGRNHVGLAVGVWSDGETWTFSRGQSKFGRSAPPRPDTIFEIGSVTKVFTGLLLADMAEEGLVALDDPVQRYLPAGIELPVRGRPIALVDMATQTSGLPRNPPGLTRLSLRQRANPHAGFTVEQLEHAIAETTLKREPGEKVSYSNFGFGLLGHVLALQTGMSYEQLVRKRICEPLNLEDTSITISPGAHERFADAHNRRGRMASHWDLPALAGAGALRSTVADLLRFVELHLREPTTRLGRAARETQETRARGGKLLQYLGWISLPLRRSPQRMLLHNGGTGGFRSFIAVVREAGVGVIVLSNCPRSVDAIGISIVEAITELS